VELAARIGVGHAVLFTGMQTDVLPFLRMAKLLVLASIEREGLSVALIEGASAGLPLVGSRLGGIPEVIEDGGNGVLVEPGNAEELASAVGRLLDDGPLRERMARRSLEVYRMRFAPGIMLGKIEALYEEALERKAHAV